MQLLLNFIHGDKLLMLYEAASNLIPFAAALTCLILYYKKKSITVTKKHLIFLAVFAVYVTGVFYFTGAGTVWEWARNSFKIRWDQVNLLPFSTDIDVVGYLLNVVLFVPLGVLLPLIWKEKSNIKSVLLCGAGFSALIEISQLVNIRCPDVDDLIMNTLGAAAGYAIFKSFNRFIRLEEDNGRYSGYEFVILTGAIFIGRFFLFNEMHLASVLYGF